MDGCQSSGSFGGPHKIYQIIKKEAKHKIGLRFIKRFLSNTDAYYLQKRVQRKFERRHIVADTIGTLGTEICKM
jgi:hypothetical protein